MQTVDETVISGLRWSVGSGSGKGRRRDMRPGRHGAWGGIWRGIRKFGFWQISVCTAERIRRIEEIPAQ